jgi:two-component system NarL family response regulator
MSKTEKNSIKILIADDHRLFREMLYHSLSEEEDFLVVGQAMDGREAIEMTQALKPDILLLDINMPRVDGIEATRALSVQCPHTRIVILTAIDDDEYLFTLIQAGATGYLLKDASSEEVTGAIRAAYSGESLIQPRLASRVLKKLTKLMKEKESKPAEDRRRKLDVLTEREREILEMVGRGLNNREIANALFISEATVKTHVMNCMHKLGLRDRVEMVLFAVQSGAVKVE